MQWPLQRDCNNFYGNPLAGGFEANLVLVTAPYQLYYGNTPIKGVRVHRKCADSLRRIFARIWTAATHNQATVDSWGASKFAGSYVLRRKRGGSTLSMHAYGCAIDLDPARNAMGNTRPNFGKPGPLAVVAAFEAEGWEWGGRWSGRSCDGMHFQAARTRAVSVADLRAAGSNTVAAADSVKRNMLGSVAAGGGAVGLLSQANDVAGQASGLASSVASGKESLGLFETHWQVILIVALAALAAYLGWRLWSASNAVIHSRLDDARFGANDAILDTEEFMDGSVLDGIEFEQEAGQ
jgi:hypothetical protein